MRAWWRGRAATAAVAVALAATVVVGCGDDGDGPASTGTTATSPTTTAAPTTTVAATGFASATVERGAGGSLTIAWELDGAEEPVEVLWSADPAAIDQPLTTVATGTSATVDDPAPGGRAYFRLVSGGAAITTAERRVVLEGVPNFRDLGGYETEDGRHVKWGQVFRSGTLHDLTPADIAAVEAIGIKLVCDLRSDSEVEEEPDQDVAADTIRVAVNDESVDVQAITDAILAGDLGQLSPTLLLEGMPKIALEFDDGWHTLIERVSDAENRPTNVHCTAGKDRAGWASALVLRTLGVPEETVMEDYLLSNEYLAASNEKTIAQVRTIVAGVNEVPEDEVDMTNLIALLDVRAEYLQAAFDAVDEEYGSFDAYLTEGLGFTEAELDAFREGMLE
jgi:protein-tyrosine phosphatase